MICVTGAESTLEALRARLRDTAEAELQEVRLDHLDDPTTPVSAVPDLEPDRLVVTCRPLRQGGRYDGDERDRVELLRRAAVAGVGFVDLEADVDPSLAGDVLDEAARGSTRVVRSAHFFSPGADLTAEMERLRSLRGHVLKLAAAVDDAAELAPLRELGGRRDRPVVLIGMGPAGLLSRVCARRFGSAWTYVAASSELATAPGQLSFSLARRWRLLGGADPSPVALLGGFQVHGSPGPSVYNQLFGDEDRRWVYLPVESARLEETLSLLLELGLVGASVTMPHKERVVPLLDELEPEAEAIGAVNTIYRRRGLLRGANTDGEGAARAIEAVRTMTSARVLVLGAGGTARAVVEAALARGAAVQVHNRTTERARALVADVCERWPDAALEVAATVAESFFDVVINATSVGLGGGSSPIEEPEMLRGAVVLDCVAQPRQTALLRQAIAVGATAVDGREMWLGQGAAQASRWLGREVSVEALRRVIDERESVSEQKSARREG